MVKAFEVANPTSCLNRSAADEPLFVLCARDITAPQMIEEWMRHRVASGKNGIDDEQIKEAHAIAREMRAWRASKGKA